MLTEQVSGSCTGLISYCVIYTSKGVKKSSGPLLKLQSYAVVPGHRRLLKQYDPSESEVGKGYSCLRPNHGGGYPSPTSRTWVSYWLVTNMGVILIDRFASFILCPKNSYNLRFQRLAKQQILSLCSQVESERLIGHIHLNTHLSLHYMSICISPTPFALLLTKRMINVTL